jgi:hypothetical protein
LANLDRLIFLKRSAAATIRPKGKTGMRGSQPLPKSAGPVLQQTCLFAWFSPSRVVGGGRLISAHRRLPAMLLGAAEKPEMCRAFAVGRSLYSTRFATALHDIEIGTFLCEIAAPILDRRPTSENRSLHRCVPRTIRAVLPDETRAACSVAGAHAWAARLR